MGRAYFTFQFPRSPRLSTFFTLFSSGVWVSLGSRSSPSRALRWPILSSTSNSLRHDSREWRRRSLGFFRPLFFLPCPFFFRLIANAVHDLIDGRLCLEVLKLTLFGGFGLNFGRFLTVHPNAVVLGDNFD